MTGDQLSALGALKAVEPIAARLDGTRQPEDRAADILELWQGTETALRALMGGSQLSGQGLIRELRQRELISLGQAYALLEFLGARDRSNRTTYSVTDNDMVVAREGFRQLADGLSAAAAAAAAAPPLPPPPPPPAPAATQPDYSRPSQSAAQPSSPYAPPPAAPAWSQPAASAAPPVSPPPSADSPTYSTPSRIPSNLWFIIAVIVLAVALIGGYFALTRRGSPEKQMNEAIASMQGGRREEARSEFEKVARENPNLSTPHIFLSRMSREEGDLVSARRELDTAIRLDPNNAVALREMGLILFSAGNYELARRFFVRAINVNPNDKAAQGYLGCALARLNRLDEAQRFITRAGPGSWSTCLPSPL
jgi:tetratricopeptide (TPR) repeat protein